MARTPQQRLRDEDRVELALQGKLLPPNDRRIHTKVAGVMHVNADGSSRQDTIAKMAQFDQLELVRNPDDPYDSNAIKVLATIQDGSEVRCIQIGHIERGIAADIAPEIDAGRDWQAIATRVAGHISHGVSMMLYRKRIAVDVDQVRRRAYELFEIRGRQDGLDQQDWQRAEAEARTKKVIAT